MLIAQKPTKRRITAISSRLVPRSGQGGPWNRLNMVRVVITPPSRAKIGPITRINPSLPLSITQAPRNSFSAALKFSSLQPLLSKTDLKYAPYTRFLRWTWTLAGSDIVATFASEPFLLIIAVDVKDSSPLKASTSSRLIWNVPVSFTIRISLLIWPKLAWMHISFTANQFVIAGVLLLSIRRMVLAVKPGVCVSHEVDPS
mmetsp:Transcript_42883/g.67263  ORF Transcript_42883/g.67263 Transcript_42883/m.67263 type:complete len:201 (-) Transcript_42883:377-979(-)